MTETRFDLSSLRQLRGAAEVGTAMDGQAVMLNLQTEDGSAEWMAMHHTRVGRFVAALLFAAGVAAQDRQTASGEGKPAGESSLLIDMLRINAASEAGADHIVLRVVLGEGANLDFRVPLDVVPALQEKIAQALATARA
ncbi:MAG: hypothetical protein E6Q93_25220 [Burkholderiaceae bacterium]|nr:MAG: hypothetical protein E6Q93_25220 [Burkholderiaceae bacterium]